MGNQNMNIQQTSGQLVQLKQMLALENRLMLKDISLGFSTGDEIHPQDDFFLLSDKGYQNFKVSEIVLFENQSNELAAIQFIYKQYQNLEKNQDFTIKGNIIGHQQIKNMSQNKIKFSDDEFIIDIKVYVEYVIDKIKIFLNNGKCFTYGSRQTSKQETYSFTAPQGFHFTCFSGSTSSHFNGLCILKADICSIEKYNTNPKSNFIEIIASNKSALRSLIPYLTVKEMSILMRAYKLFAKILSNEVLFIDEIGRRALFSGNINLIKYYQNLIKQESLASEQKNNLRTYQDNIKNYVQNPHGEDKFRGFEFLSEYGQAEQKDSYIENLNGLTHFKFSYMKNILVWKRKMHDIFTANDIENIENSSLAIVFGIEIADSNYGGSLTAEVQIQDEAHNCIFIQRKKFDTIQRGFKFYNIAGYIKKQNLNQSKPQIIIFSISGQDSRFWAGHFGPRLRSITCRLIPVLTQQEINLFNNSFKNVQ
ncbi:F-box protein (macronuclear) [Tetrahymena thermophila SB210]|uniref:F-box protein n=1 Tax=Tetrahymena thermophila (strain SB210) TaxID=312017 RepID=Q23A87_TETTS|nr:F-box protein [Tetrahymena thermophila SB210]EAR93393.1 F-box protein [Tetrahymena thermophila SB210]|eukprot:XP_001013638.1 F-box protein [Tetrahymena thermophila SB210]